MTISKLTARAPFEIIFSNPKRPYWRTRHLLKSGDTIEVEVVERPYPENPRIVGIRWWRTEKTYWYALVEIDEKIAISP